MTREYRTLVLAQHHLKAHARGMLHHLNNRPSSFWRRDNSSIAADPKRVRSASRNARTESSAIR